MRQAVCGYNSPCETHRRSVEGNVMWVSRGRQQLSALAHLENKELVIRPDGGKEDVPTLSAIEFRESFLL